MCETLLDHLSTDSNATNNNKPTVPQINDEQRTALTLLCDLIKIDSQNDHEAKVALHLQQFLASYGISSKLVEFCEGRSSLVAEIHHGDGKTLAISGHLDVVSAGDVSLWTHPPFSAHIDDDGVLWGRGASDMKSGLAALVMAMIHLNETKNFTGTIRLMATVGEEVGEYGSQQLTKLGYMDDVDGLLIAEPCNVGIIHAHKGSLNYKVIAKGMAAHSSMPELGNNAIEQLNDAMTQITADIRTKADAITNPLLGNTLHNITLIQGGTQVNSIPDHAEFEANARTVPEYDNQTVIHDIQAIIDTLNTQDGYELSLIITADQPPVYAAPDSPLIHSIINSTQDLPRLQVPYLLDSMGQVLNQDLSSLAQKFPKGLAPITASGTTDAAQFLRHQNDVDLAVYGPGIPMLNHKIDERINIGQYFDFIDAYQAIIANYLNSKS
ncbi:ArgE/DapE family deacylase [Moraxella porci]|uniref:ArgE/DapE family deacylase n=1 Tax=Moraxella porci TaxID=1288392 RepID=UPI000993E551|nr:ArgE/DapE family deacylase [Moraxella porci]